MMKKIAVWSLMVLLAGGSAWACQESGQCSMEKKSDCSEKGGCPIVAKTVKKAGFFLDNKEALSLSEEQVSEIKTIKLEAEKLQIRHGAEMQIMMLDMQTMMHQEPLDVEGFNAYIDKGTAGMAAGGKQAFAAYAKLKAVLNKDQMTKAKAIWSKK